MSKLVVSLFTTIALVLGAITLALILYIDIPTHVRAEVGSTGIPTPIINTPCKTCNNTTIELTKIPCESCNNSEYVIDAKSYNGSDQSLPSPTHRDLADISLDKPCNCSSLIIDAKDYDSMDPSMPVPTNKVIPSSPASLESTSESTSCVYSICGWATTEYSDFLDWRFSDPTCTGGCYWIGGCGYRYATYCPSGCVGGSSGRGCCYSICGKDTSEYSTYANWKFSDPTCTGSCYWINNCGYRYATYCPTGCNNGCCYSICGKDTSEYSTYANWRFSDPTCTGSCYWINNCGYRNAEHCNSGCSDGSCQSPVCSTGWKCNAEGRGSNWKGYQNPDCSWTGVSNCDASDGYISSNYCYDNDVYRDYNDYYCSGGSCLYSTTRIKQSECGIAGCSNGQCNPCPAPLTPSNPSPAIGATNVQVAIRLDWEGTANSYDIYLGESSPPPFFTTVTDSQYTGVHVLNPNKDYYWQIKAKNDCGTTPSPIWTFHTRADWTFAVITDLHIGEGVGDYDDNQWDDVGDNEWNNYTNDKCKSDFFLRQIVNNINWNVDYNFDNIAFVVVTGDLSDSGELSEFRKAREILGTLKVPWLPVIGNHDTWPFTGPNPRWGWWICDNIDAEQAPMVAADGKVFDSYFNDAFGYRYSDFPKELGVTSSWVRPIPGVSNPEVGHICNFQNFAFDYGSYHFIGLDFASRKKAPCVQLVGWHGTKPDGDMHTYLGGTWGWFASHLMTYVNDNPGINEKVILFSHYPFKIHVNAFLTYFGFGDDELRDIGLFLKDYKDAVFAQFAGHTHPERFYNEGFSFRGCFIWSPDSIEYDPPVEDILNMGILPANKDWPIALLVPFGSNGLIDYSQCILLPEHSWALEAHCPVNLEVTYQAGDGAGTPEEISSIAMAVESPTGNITSEKRSGIDSSLYFEEDINGDGVPEKLMYFPDREEGTYEICVTAEEGASTTDNFSLILSPMEQGFGYTPIVLAENVSIGEISPEGKVYKFEFTERTATNITYTGALSGYNTSTIDLSAVLTTCTGDPLAGKTVTFTISNQSVSTVSTSNGKATASMTLEQLPSEYYYVDAAFDGDIDYLPSYASEYFSVYPSPSPSPSPSPTPSATPSASPSPSSTPSASSRPSSTPSATPTPSPTATESPALSATPTESPTPTPSPTPGKYGDTNGDSYIDSFDLIVMQNMILQKSPAYPSGDANGDGYIDSFDLVIIQNIILGKTTAIVMNINRYDFHSVGGSDKWARRNSIISAPPALDAVFDADPAGWVEATSAEYIDISDQDGGVWNISGSSGNYTMLQCKFNVAEGAYAENVTSIGVTFNGNSQDSGDVLQLWVWNFTSGAWQQVGTDISLGGSDNLGYTTWTMWGRMYSDCIDSNNYMYVLYNHKTFSKYLNVDYVKLEIVASE